MENSETTITRRS